MIFYSFYLSKWKEPESLVYRTEEGHSPLQINMKFFATKDEAQSDFFKLLYDHEELRIGEYFDTEKGKKTTKEKSTSSAPKVYDSIPSDFKLELNKVYNLKAEVFMQTVPKAYFDYIFTSPPYNITKQIGSDDLYAEYEDNMGEEEYYQWLCGIIDEGMRCVKKHFFMNIQMLGKNKRTVLRIFGRYAMMIKDRMIWNKKIAPPHIQQGILNSKFEDIIIFSHDKPETKKFSDANWSQGSLNNVIEGLNASGNQYSDLNKATFPLYLPRTFMINFGKKGDIWYDPFTGTGTTFQAAEIEGRDFVGTELDSLQCDATNQRVWVEKQALKMDFSS